MGLFPGLLSANGDFGSFRSVPGYGGRFPGFPGNATQSQKRASVVHGNSGALRQRGNETIQRRRSCPAHASSNSYGNAEGPCEAKGNCPAPSHGATRGSHPGDARSMYGYAYRNPRRGHAGPRLRRRPAPLRDLRLAGFGYPHLRASGQKLKAYVSDCPEIKNGSIGQRPPNCGAGGQGYSPYSAAGNMAVRVGNQAAVRCSGQ